MNKKVWIILGAIVVIGVVIASTKGKQGDVVKLETGNVESRTIVETVSASGKIQPEVEVKISPEVSGEIIELPVEEGQFVEAGTLLLRINPDLYIAAQNRTRAAMNSARSSVAQAEAQFIEAEKSFNRSKSLYENGVLSQAEWEAAQRAFRVSELTKESAQFQLESAEATYKEAQDNFKRTTIVAPVSGTISALNVELGERVVGTAQMAGTELLRIANLNDMEVLVEVNENDIVKVGLSDTADIEVDAYLGKRFKGVVTEIANSANIDGMTADQVTNFEVKVRILRASYTEGEQVQPFRPGMTASVDIQTNRQEGVLTVPIEAVTVRDDTLAMSYSEKLKSRTNQTKDKDPYEVVFVPNGDEVKLVVVKTGIQDESFIEIESGLEEGQTIVVGPYEEVSKNLNPGDKMQVESQEKEE